jgi:hypothetical protein
LVKATKDIITNLSTIPLLNNTALLLPNTIILLLNNIPILLLLNKTPTVQTPTRVLQA